MNEHTIYLGGGCFWGLQGYIKKISGVLSTEVGYANGPTENPSYEDVCHNAEIRSYAVLAVVSNCCPPLKGRLITRYSPVRH